MGRNGYMYIVRIGDLYVFDLNNNGILIDQFNFTDRIATFCVCGGENLHSELIVLGFGHGKVQYFNFEW